MSDPTAFDWTSLPIPTDFAWAERGIFTDANGISGEIGVNCQLLCAALAFDEKGQKSGLFPSGSHLKVSAISSNDPTLLYVEGTDVSGFWAMTGVQPVDVKIVTKAPISA